MDANSRTGLYLLLKGHSTLDHPRIFRSSIVRMPGANYGPGPSVHLRGPGTFLEKEADNGTLVTEYANACMAVSR